MVKIFVYGTLMRGFGNHTYLTGQKYLGKAFTVDKYLMTAAWIPYVANIQSEHSTYVLGEVYEVDEKAFREIDLLEGHPSFYERRLIAVRLEDGTIDECWMYFNHGTKGHTVIESGNYYLWRFMNEVTKSEVSYDKTRKDKQEGD